MAYIIVADRWFLAVVLFLAGITKVGDTGHLVQVIERYKVVPARLVRPVATVLPAGELLLAVALAAGLMPGLAGWLSFICLLTFTGAVGWNLRHGRRFDCGCGLGAQQVIGWGLVLRDAVLALLALAIAVRPVTALSVFPGWPQAAGPEPSAAKLIPVPLIVILLAAATRLARQHLAVLNAARTRTHRSRGTDSIAGGQLAGSPHQRAGSRA